MAHQDPYHILTTTDCVSPADFPAAVVVAVELVVTVQQQQPHSRCPFDQASPVGCCWQNWQDSDQDSDRPRQHSRAAAVPVAAVKQSTEPASAEQIASFERLTDFARLEGAAAAAVVVGFGELEQRAVVVGSVAAEAAKN